MTAEELAALLPPDVPGFAPAPVETIRLGGFESASAPVLLEDAGFRSGAQRTFRADADQVTVQVLQFADERGPRRYEALRMSTWCASSPRRVAVPEGSGASGSVIVADDGIVRTRFAVIRGSRDYLVNFADVHPAHHAAILEAALASVR